MASLTRATPRSTRSPRIFFEPVNVSKIACLLLANALMCLQNDHWPTESSAADMNACSLAIKFSLIIVLSTPPVCLHFYFERFRATARQPRTMNAVEMRTKLPPRPARLADTVCQQFLSNFLMPNLMPSPFRNTRHTNKVARFISSIPCIPTALRARSSIF